MLDKSRREMELSGLVDSELVRLAREGSAFAVRLIVHRHDKTLHRVARAIVRDSIKAEDVMQDAYLSAFGSLEKFRADATLSTWLTRIVVNKAILYLRRENTMVSLQAAKSAELEAERVAIPNLPSEPNPESAAAQSQIRDVLDRAIDELPEPLRLVFLMRMVEQLSVRETSSSLGIREETVRTRLYRAKKLMREQLQAKLVSGDADVIPVRHPCRAYLHKRSRGAWRGSAQK